MNRIVLLTAFDGQFKQGHWHAHIADSVSNILKYLQCPILLLTDDPDEYKSPLYEVQRVSVISRNHERQGYRSSNYWRIKWPLQHKDTTILYIDLDIRIISKAFIKGFDLAEKFGFCLPISPRAFACIENTCGIDALGRQDKPAEFASAYSHATSYITGVMFIRASILSAGKYLREYIRLYETKPQRAPSLAIEAAMNSCFAPYVLPPQWCVTYHNKDFIYENTRAKPLAIHISDEGVLDTFTKELKN